MKKTNKQIFSTLVTFCWIFSVMATNLFPLSVKAADITVPNTTSSSDTTENNINNETLADAGTRKNTPPQLSMQFSADGAIKQGSNVTAEATTSGFSQQDSDLYFTWYLKHKGCELTGDAKGAGEGNCDLDGDGQVTVNDWKIAAARIIVDGGFDNTGVDYSSSANNNYDPSSSGTTAVPSVTSKDGWITNFERDNNEDSNGEAFGCTNDPDQYNVCQDNSSDDSVPYCYVQDAGSGLTYELRKAGKIVYNPCPSGYHKACLTDMSGQCTTPNADSNAGTKDEITGNIIPKSIIWNANVCGIKSEASNATDPANGMDCGGSSVNTTTFSDPVTCGTNADGTDVEAICIPDKNNSSASNGTYNGDFLDVLSATNIIINGSGASTSTPSTYGRIFNNVCSNNNAQSLLTSTDVPNDPANSDPYVWGSAGEGFNLTNSSGGTIGSTTAYNSSSPTVPATFVGTPCSQLTQDLVTGNSSLQPTCTRSGGGDNACKHLFPYFPKDSVTGADGKTINLNLKDSDLQNNNTPLDILGSGKFTLNEKEFWGADPTKASTNGFEPDEAAVMGLGVTNFTWQYAQGDEVGVAVEGDSQQPTVHADGSKKRMWAFSNNTCNALKDDVSDGSADPSYYTETAPDGGGTMGIEVVNFDPNDCLPENLLDPIKSMGSSSNMTVSLTSSEDQPIDVDPTVDPSGQGDTVTINSTVGNSSGDQKNMLYDWHVELSKDGSDAPTSNTQWEDVTTDMQQKYDSFPASAQTGAGKDSFQFNLNLPFDYINGINPNTSDNGYFYLRINAKVSEAEGDNSQNSNGTIILKVYEQKNSINVYSVTADSTGKLTPNDPKNSSSPDQICTGSQDVPNCSAVQDEILALEVPNATNQKLDNFSWTVNGNSATCDPTFSSNCDPNSNNYQKNLLFIPISGEIGDIMKVEATALNESTNDHITVDKNFQIVSYGANIVSGDTTAVQPKVKGYFKNLDGTSTPDNSTTNFLTTPGSTMVLDAQFVPSWVKDSSDPNTPSQVSYNWTVDGAAYGSANQKELSIPVSKDIGENYNIGLSASFTPGTSDQINNLREALLNDWQISLDDSTEQTAQANIQIDVVDSGTASDGGQSGPFGANLLSHVPEQVLFSVRLILTGFLLLFVTGLIFSFMPNYEEEEK